MRAWGHFLVSIPALTLGAAAALLGCRSPDPAPPLRNVVLIVVDTLRADHLRAYGYHRETAPTFTRLAKEGVLWDAVAPSSWTLPGVASILTGLHPVRHRTFGGSRDALPFEAATLAERLQPRGYSSLAVIANPWITRDAGFAQGFTSFYSMLQDLKRPRFSTAEEVNAELLPRLASLEPPFFLYVHYLDPHAPYDPVRDYRGWPLLGRLGARKKGVTIQELRMEESIERSPELLADARDLYDGEIRRADDAIGQLLGRLRALGLDRGTLTIVTSDHGEEMAEHGRMGHGQTLYEEVVRVPLVFHAPRRLEAGARRGTASLLDVAPTVLELLGEAVSPSDLDGISLAPFVRLRPPTAAPAPTPPVRELLLHLDVRKAGSALALRGDQHALVLSMRPDRPELFDLVPDPDQRADLLATQAGRATMRVLAERLARRYNELSSAALPERGKGVPRNVDALIALGYLAAAAASSDVRCIPPTIEPAEPPPAATLGWTGC